MLALAAAINELTEHTRRARTAMWCGLQMASRDMPAQCMRTAAEAHSTPCHSANTSTSSALLNTSVDSSGEAGLSSEIRHMKLVQQEVDEKSGSSNGSSEE